MANEKIAFAMQSEKARMAMTSSVSCATVAPGAKGTIRSIIGPVSFRTRLRSFGIRPGLELEVIRRAPWGDPVEIAVRNVHLMLRLEDADLIYLDID